MQVIPWAWIGLVILYGSLPLPDAVTVESGTFLLFLAGKPVGRESYSHQKDDKQEIWSGTVEIQAAGQELKQKPRLVLTSEGKPISFDLVYSTGGAEQSLSYAFGDGSFTITAKGGEKDSTQELPLPANAVILANNVLHHNILVARRYDWKKGGRQELVAVPNTTLALEARGEEEFTVNGSAIKLRHLFLSIGGIIGANLWLDSSERLIKMDIPLQRIEVYLQGFEKMQPSPATVVTAGAALQAFEVNYPSEDHTMAGTLTLPIKRSGPLPAVILISDTGPQTRDGDSPGVGGLKMGIFRTIAEKLSSNGIAVLRYDDRGVGKSGGNFPAANMTDFEKDARAAITYLRTLPEIDPRRIGIVGYNEGALLGAHIAAESPEIKALISMACPARNGEEILRWQQEKSLARLNLREADYKAEEQKGLAFIEAVKKAEGDVAEIEDQRINVRWFREFLSYEPLPVFSRVKCPVAIIQGGKDIQVPPEDAETLNRVLTESGNSEHELRSYPNLGHLFTDSSGDGMAEMADTKKRVSEEVLNYILGFLKRKL
jgi:dienelactone hydrolase